MIIIIAIRFNYYVRVPVSRSRSESQACFESEKTEPKGSRLVSKPNRTGANKNAVCSPIECAGVSSFAKRLAPTVLSARGCVLL